MKIKRIFLSMLIVLLILSTFSCATAIAVPRNATPEQIEEINAQNLNAIATNTSTLAAIQLASLITGFIVGLMAAR